MNKSCYELACAMCHMHNLQVTCTVSQVKSGRNMSWMYCSMARQELHSREVDSNLEGAVVKNSDGSSKLVLEHA